MSSAYGKVLLKQLFPGILEWSLLSAVFLDHTRKDNIILVACSKWIIGWVYTFNRCRYRWGCLPEAWHVPSDNKTTISILSRRLLTVLFVTGLKYHSINYNLSARTHRYLEIVHFRASGICWMNLPLVNSCSIYKYLPINNQCISHTAQQNSDTSSTMPFFSRLWVPSCPTAHINHSCQCI